MPAQPDPEQDESLVVGADGVTRLWAEHVSTVRFDECAGVRRWNDYVDLWSTDGFWISIDPTDWENGDEAVSAVLDKAPAELVVPGYVDVPLADPDIRDGVAAAGDGDVERTVELLEDAVVRVSDEPLAWQSLAWAWHRRDQFALAAHAARKALELDPEDDYALRMLAQSLKRLGKGKEAAENARLALQVDPGSIDNMTLAVEAFIAAGQFEEAESVVRQIRELYPDSEEASFAAGWLAQATGDHAQALEELRAATEVAPESTMAHNNFGWALAGACQVRRRAGRVREGARVGRDEYLRDSQPSRRASSPRAARSGREAWDQHLGEASIASRQR